MPDTQKSPDAFRTIGEVASWLAVPPHVLRFWESKFAQVRPVKRAGGRRYYRRGDMALLGGIKVLLHDKGMTIKGVQRILSEDGTDAVSAHAPEIDADASEDAFAEAPMANGVEAPREAGEPGSARDEASELIGPIGAEDPPVEDAAMPAGPDGDPGEAGWRRPGA